MNLLARLRPKLYLTYFITNEYTHIVIDDGNSRAKSGGRFKTLFTGYLKD